MQSLQVRDGGGLNPLETEETERSRWMMVYFANCIGKIWLKMWRQGRGRREL